MEITLWFFIILVVLGIILYIILVFNSIVRLKNNIRKSWSNIGVLLKQRNDELPNLIEAAKGYMKHEKSLFVEITKARTKLMSCTKKSDKAKEDNKITESLKTIFAVSEDYPKLQANQNFLKLQERITGIENELADRREFYNDSVNLYNIRIQSFPDMAVAKIFKYIPEEMFQVSEGEKKKVSAKI